MYKTLYFAKRKHSSTIGSCLELAYETHCSQTSKTRCLSPQRFGIIIKSRAHLLSQRGGYLMIVRTPSMLNHCLVFCHLAFQQINMGQGKLKWKSLLRVFHFSWEWVTCWDDIYNISGRCSDCNFTIRTCQKQNIHIPSATRLHVCVNMYSYLCCRINYTLHALQFSGILDVSCGASPSS